MGLRIFITYSKRLVMEQVLKNIRKIAENLNEIFASFCMEDVEPAAMPELLFLTPGGHMKN